MNRLVEVGVYLIIVCKAMGGAVVRDGPRIDPRCSGEVFR
jgi:hypothetical protein